MKPNTSLSIRLQVQGGYETFLNFLKLAPTCPDLVARALRGTVVRKIRSVTSTTVQLFMPSARSIMDLSSVAFSCKNQPSSWLPSMPQLESLKYHEHTKMMMVCYMQTWIHSYFKAVHSMHFLNSHTQVTAPTECTVLTLRRLMSYIYGAPILDVSRSHTTTQHSQ